MDDCDIKGRILTLDAIAREYITGSQKAVPGIIAPIWLIKDALGFIMNVLNDPDQYIIAKQDLESLFGLPEDMELTLKYIGENKYKII